MTAVYQSIVDFYLSNIVGETLERMEGVKEYSMVLGGSEDTQEKLRSLFINLGTNLLLRDDQRSIQMANVAAAFYIISSHDFNYWEAMDLSKHRVTFRNLENGLIYESAKFFHKRTPCQCLKKIYLRERLKPRQARCSYCDEVKERRQLYLCADCLYHHYCGVDCQAGHWPKHKRDCKGFNPRTDCGL